MAEETLAYRMEVYRVRDESCEVTRYIDPIMGQRNQWSFLEFMAELRVSLFS